MHTRVPSPKWRRSSRQGDCTDSAHGTNPASAAMCGYEIVEIPSGEDGRLDLDALRAAVGDDTAAMMITNPSTLGIFRRNCRSG